MENTTLLLPALLVLAVILTGCTGQPAAPTPSATPAASTGAAAAAATLAGPSLSGTVWKLGWYDDTKGVWSSVIQGSTITATFSPGGVVNGLDGCVEYTTEYKLLQPPGIWFRRPAVPQTTCSKPTGVDNQQSAYFTDLMNSETYTISNSQLQMFDKTGKKILQFDPMS